MSDKFLDPNERTLYMSVATGLHVKFPSIPPESVDRTAWHAVERYRSRNWDLMTKSQRDEAGFPPTPVPAAETEKTPVPEHVHDALCDAVAQGNLDFLWQGSGRRPDEPSESFDDAGPTDADLRGEVDHE